MHRKYAATAFQGIQKEGDGEEESHFDAGEGLGISDFATDPDIYIYIDMICIPHSAIGKP